MVFRRQFDFFDHDINLRKNRVSHGGRATQGQREATRPLDRRKPLHVVLKSSYAKGRLSFLGARNRLWIDRIIRDYAKRFGVTVHRYENMGNHIHLLVSFTRRICMQSFLRTVPGLIARFVTGARRGRAFGKKFWDHLVFSRVVTGRRDFANMMNYLVKNEIEREGGSLSRDAVEQYDEAMKRAKRRGVDVWIVLDEINRANAP